MTIYQHIVLFIGARMVAPVSKGGAFAGIFGGGEVHLFVNVRKPDGPRISRCMRIIVLKIIAKSPFK